jgi:thymidylate synthase ThyX
MKIDVLETYGYYVALYGMALSFGLTSELDPETWCKDLELLERLEKRANALAKMDGGHNNFLEQISVGMVIDAPRYWWQQFDRYRVGTTRQSESTMHTLMKRPLYPSDFEGGCEERLLDILNDWQEIGNFDKLKRHLPESFLQKRTVTINYKSLRNIILQRRTHRLPEWKKFCKVVVQDAGYPEFLPDWRVECSS